MSDSTNFAILDTVEQMKDGYKEPRVGEWYLTSNPNPERDMAAGSVLLAGSYPELATIYKMPAPSQISTSARLTTPDTVNALWTDPDNPGAILTDNTGNTASINISFDGGVTWPATAKSRSTWTGYSTATEMVGFAYDPVAKRMALLRTTGEVGSTNAANPTAVSRTQWGLGSGAPTEANWCNLFFNQGKFFALYAIANDSFEVWTSSNAVNWSRAFSASHTTHGVDGVKLGTTVGQRQIAFDDSTVVIPSKNCFYVSSDNGITWKKVLLPVTSPTLISYDIGSCNIVGGDLYVQYNASVPSLHNSATITTVRIPISILVATENNAAITFGDLSIYSWGSTPPSGLGGSIDIVGDFLIHVPVSGTPMCSRIDLQSKLMLGKTAGHPVTGSLSGVVNLLPASPGKIILTYNQKYIQVVEYSSVQNYIQLPAAPMTTVAANGNYPVATSYYLRVR